MNSRHTALQCFTAVARHHGLDLSVERLAHEHALDESEPDTTKVLRIAQDNGFKARAAQLDWDALKRQPVGALPALLRLKNGNTVVALGFKPEVRRLLLRENALRVFGLPD